MTQQAVITFIGAGNMAFSLIGGMVADGYDAKAIWATNPSEQKLNTLQSRFQINITQDNRYAAQQADVIVLSVKPHVVPEAARELKDIIQQQKPLLISIAAGVGEQSLQRWVGGNTAIVRCMPNTPALVGSGATALYSNALVNQQQKDLAESIMRAVGVIQWLQQESHMDTVTALSGSGPAYFFYFMEALQQGAQHLGLPADVARLLTVQTALGAARLALETGESFEGLRQSVTSKGGTTEQALNTLMTADAKGLIEQALKAAHDRAQQLEKLLGEK